MEIISFSVLVHILNTQDKDFDVNLIVTQFLMLMVQGG